MRKCFSKLESHFNDVLVFGLSYCLSLLFSDAGARRDSIEQPVVLQGDDDEEGEWIVLQTSRPRTQQIKESDGFGQSRSTSQSPTPQSRNSVKP